MLTTRTARLIERLRAKEGQIRILFVCLGNICRSPAANGIFEDLIITHNASTRFKVDSAGIIGYHAGEEPDRRMIVHARRRGLNLTHLSRPVKSTDFEDFDIILGMDDANISDLRNLAPSIDDMEKIVPTIEFVSIPSLEKFSSLEESLSDTDSINKLRSLSTNLDYIPDPYYSGAEGFELVLDLLSSACSNLFTLLYK